MTNHINGKACPDPEDGSRPLNLHGRNWSRRLCAFIPAEGVRITPFYARSNVS